MAKIGILYDNISGNTGDVAIGLSLKKILCDIEFDELIPGNFNPHKYDTIIIAGGHLIRPSPDFFYDKFKVSGKHILNAVGILGAPDDLSYLDDYKYVTVRTSWDKERLSCLKTDVQIVPCTTMLLEDIGHIPITPKSPSLGIHLIPFFLNANDEKQFVEWISSLPFTIYFLPIMHYNRDYIYLRNLSSKIKNSVILPLMNPQEILTFIGKLDYFIGSSLHGRIFSYKHNVHFILFKYNEKMLYFMKDRGLEQYTFSSLEDMQVAFNKLLIENPDYSKQISRDLDSLRKHVEHLKEILPSNCFNKMSCIDFSDPRDYQIQNLQSCARSLESQLKDYEINMEAISDKLQEAISRTSTPEKNVVDRDAQISSLEHEIIEMQKSVIWQMMMRFHYSFIERTMPHGTQRRDLYDLGLKACRILSNEGMVNLGKKFQDYIKEINGLNDYELWIQKNEPSKKDVREMRLKAKYFPYKPLISIITPVWNIDDKLLRAAIDSVLNQIYVNWELCIVDGGSTKPQVKKALEEYSRKDKRIKIKYLETNKGISENSNEALLMASGEFIGLLDHDDILAPFALYEIVNLMNQNQKLDFIYSDEDKIDEKGVRSEPFFKPEWDPDLILSCGYTNHLGIYRRDIVNIIGGFRSELEWSQDYDMLLRFTEVIEGKNIGHIPKVLYHWRKIKGSTSIDAYAKNGLVINAAKRALKDALERRNIKATVLDGKWPSSYRIKRDIFGKPLVSIIIPTKDQLKMIKNCIDSIKSKTSYENYEILLVDNNSSESDTLEYIKRSDYHLLKFPNEFNFSKINNFAAEHAKGDYLIFLNNDTEVITPHWIQAMLEHAQRPEVGAVGCKLLYPDRSIQHAGIVLGLSPDHITGVAGHVCNRFRYEDPGYFGLINTIRNYSAVTGATMMIKKQIFEEIGGFNEKLAVCYNDVDLCLRLRDRGYLIIYTPYAELYHFESVSKDHKVNIREAEYMMNKWRILIKNDPYYSPNLSLRTYNCEMNI
jgi:GT2 family glycosyltransferase